MLFFQVFNNFLEVKTRKVGKIKFWGSKKNWAEFFQIEFKETHNFFPYYFRSRMSIYSRFVLVSKEFQGNLIMDLRIGKCLGRFDRF